MALKLNPQSRNLDTRIKKLISELEENGWKVTGEIEDPLDWWADEILEIISKWNPGGTKVYLTTIVDPQWGTTEIDFRKKKHRKPRQGIWAIGISVTIPNERLYDFDIQYSLNELTEPNIQRVIGQLEELRKNAT